MTERTRILVPSGVLGLGFDRKALARGVSMEPDAICIDGGSTDSGPHYLGTGTSKYAEPVIAGEWRQLMEARSALGVPLIIGSCGTCGTAETVDQMYAVTDSIARDLGQRVRVARLYSDQDPASLDPTTLVPLNPAPKIDGDSLATCSHVVALAGAEQMQAALASGADIVLAGRATDTAVISALPLMRGANPGAAWHGAKVTECGALCSTRPTSGVVVADFDADGFEVQPMADGASCTPYTVSAHMLYENADPYILHEPGGALDVTAARYVALDDRRVRVEGSVWREAPYTVKLEGARIAGYQTTALVLLRDARYVRAAPEWAESLRVFLQSLVSERMGLLADAYTLEFRLIGHDAALGTLETGCAVPNEIGVLMIVTADSQATARQIARMANPHLLHHLTPDEELPSFAFPYSPAETDRGTIHEFALNHLMPLSDPMAAFRIEVDDAGAL